MHSNWDSPLSNVGTTIFSLLVIIIWEWEWEWYLNSVCLCHELHGVSGFCVCIDFKDQEFIYLVWGNRGLTIQKLIFYSITQQYNQWMHTLFVHPHLLNPLFPHPDPLLKFHIPPAPSLHSFLLAAFQLFNLFRYDGDIWRWALSLFVNESEAKGGGSGGDGTTNYSNQWRVQNWASA